MTKVRTLEERLIAALTEHTKAKQAKPAENPLVNHDLASLTHGVGVAKGADHFPALNMADEGIRTRGEERERTPVETSGGYGMEVARNAALTEGKADKSAKRMAAARARAARKVQFDKIADSPTQPSKARMTEAWYVVFPLVSEVTRIANGKSRWAARFLGSVTDDIPQMALEKMALVLAKSDKDLGLLREAADQIAGEVRIKGFAGDQGEPSDDERKHMRELRKARKWLMGMSYNRVMGALVDVYTHERNLRWDNIDVIATVMASINGMGDDPLTSNFKVDRAPAFLGTKFQRPGGIDAGVLAAGIGAAITERGLDATAEIILDEGNRRTNGQVKWSKIAEQVFLATPSGGGEWMWDVIVQATEHLDRVSKARGDAARKHARGQFAFLPSVVVNLVESFDPHVIGWSTKGSLVARNAEGEAVRLRPTAKDAQTHAVLASDFELFYLSDQERTLLRPALRFASVEEAAEVLAETLGLLTTGEDLVRSVVHT